MPSLPAPIPATFRRRCSPTPARSPSLSAIPSGGKIMPRPTRWCAPRRWRRAAPASSPSFASARRAPNATPGRRSPSWAPSSTAHCLTPRRALSSPTSRSGRSAPGSRRRRAMSPNARLHSRAARARASARAGQAIRILYGGSVKPGNAKELPRCRKRRRRPCRWCEPQSRRVPGDCRRLPVGRAEWPPAQAAIENPHADHVETRATSHIRGVAAGGPAAAASGHQR